MSLVAAVQAVLKACSRMLSLAAASQAILKACLEVEDVPRSGSASCSQSLKSKVCLAAAVQAVLKACLDVEEVVTRAQRRLAASTLS